MAVSSNKAKESDVEIHYRVNKLKMKAGADMEDGAGFIDGKDIRSAQAYIDSKNEDYTDEVHTMLNDLEKIWGTLSQGEDEDMLTAMYHKSNHIKDLAGTYSYALMLHFAKSLREFIEVLDVANDAHKTIVRAHIDVMWVVFHEKLKDSEDEKAQELKTIVVQAIEKHS